MPDLTEQLAEALRTGWRDGAPFVADEAEGSANRISFDRYAAVLLPVVERYARQYAADQLAATAHAWQWSGWADTPRHADRVADRIGAAQYVAEWLRARAANLREGTA